MATGIDNSGLYEGKREAMGIIKTLASDITSFDIFGGIGISAATAFAQAAKSSYEFEKEFRKNMLEVATISTQVTDDMTGFMNQVMSITQEIPIKAPEAAKALYSIVSAGHDGADGMKILEVSAKAAVGGLTETETAADAITTILNAYKMSAEEAGTVSDQLFTTVRLGKTTFGELGASIAQVAPIAAAYGISIDQVLGAVASLTKQGTPTAQAMTQIRYKIFFTPETQDQFDFTQYDYVVDAIDTVTGKIALVVKAKEAGTPIICAMGAGNKMDPTRFEVTDIYKTSVCPLAKVMRTECRKRRIKHLKVVYSKEPAMTPIEDDSISCKNHCICPPGTQRKCTIRRSVPGSNAFVPSVAGLIIGGEVVKDLVGFVPMKG